MEDSKHYLLHCPLFDNARLGTISTLNANYTVNDLLNGSPFISVDMNNFIFKTVQNFITTSRRFDL